MSWFIVLLVFLLAAFKTEKPKKYMKVSVIIPAFNEEETVANVIKVIREVRYVDEIIVVNDGSTDNTEAEAKSAGAIVINHEVNKGKGEALTTGYKKSDSDIIAFIDADIHNLTSKKVDAMIRPILEGKTDITKTKFARESGRVTELTAKPLLNFFFPEISFEQPLSGQFAAKRSALKKIDFEKDYGVDVGIVIDADVLGISVEEVDIGEIEHDMSPLSDLNLMANEVVRTIIDRANKYGRVVMIDDIGYFIRMAIVGLSLIILGLFAIFFVKQVPLALGVIVSIVGIIIAICYIIKVIIKSIVIYRKAPTGNLIKSFVKVHFPLIISVIILILMISTFIGAATFEDGTISIEPSSRNLIIFADNSNDTISVRGPYTVDSAIENESNIIRMPADALQTLGMQYNDTLIVNGVPYLINDTRTGEGGILRLPIDAKNALNLEDGDSLQDSRLSQVFEGTVINHNSNKENVNLMESYIISSKPGNCYSYGIYIDNESIDNSTAIFEDNNTYSVAINQEKIGTIEYQNASFTNNTQTFYHNGHVIEIKFDKTSSSSVKHVTNIDQGFFINLNFIKVKKEVYDLS
ncbi:glycosyltransferase [uncultured Methanobrevibacter sp.]|uniref:glycosyltransferase n=1 Tax=uncultured Methanobrevibacter sp. TaxID=253161 RepID=UPI00260A39FA|nr:glycosyltransferase [uncultured Methanobrevibacter sp.]